MELGLHTLEASAISTEGMLDIEGIFECYTLELPEDHGEPGYAIPAGRYPVVLQPSPKFIAQMTDLDLPFGYRQFVAQYAQRMPHIIDIPGRDLIMFHWGNTPADTKGCVCTGRTRGENFIGSSRPAFAAFYPKIAEAAASRNCFVTVER